MFSSSKGKKVSASQSTPTLGAIKNFDFGSDLFDSSITNNGAIRTYCRLRPVETQDESQMYKIRGDTLILNPSPNQGNGNLTSSSRVIKKPIVISSSKKHKTGQGSATSNSVSSDQKNQSNPRSEYEFSFNKVFDYKATNDELFNSICIPCINDLFEKQKSSLIFAYGLSNSGKTFSITGDTGENPGILPLTIVNVFGRGLTLFSSIKCTYVEIYNEEVYDLLTPGDEKAKIQIKEKDKIFFLNEVSIRTIKSIKDFEKALNDGINKKIHSSTKINQLSSRSHTIFKIIIDDFASISICDLAGAERANKAETKGAEFFETCKINTSLMTLGRCIDAMEINSRFVQMDKKVPVPIRESKLTKIFQEYFTGDANVIMLTTINPTVSDFNENKNVLSYACKAKKVKPIRSWVVKKSNISSNVSNTNSEEDYKTDFVFLMKEYEETMNENDDLRVQNELLVQKMRMMENEHKIDIYNQIVTRGRDFLEKVWNDMTEYNLNKPIYPNEDPNKPLKYCTLINPKFKSFKEDQESSSDQSKRIEISASTNVEIIGKQNTNKVDVEIQTKPRTKKKKIKTVKEIAESFTIDSISNSTELNTNNVFNENEESNSIHSGFYSESEISKVKVVKVGKKKKGKKKSKKVPEEDTTEKESDVDEEEEKKEENSSKDKKKKGSKKERNKEKKSKKREMSVEKIEETDENFEESEKKPEPKKKKTKSKKTIPIPDMSEESDKSDKSESDEVKSDSGFPILKKKKKTKKKTKKKK